MPLHYYWLSICKHSALTQAEKGQDKRAATLLDGRSFSLG